VNELIVISSGECNLFGFYNSLGEEEKKILLVTLPECSWFGDFQIMLNMDSTF